MAHQIRVSTGTRLVTGTRTKVTTDQVEIKELKIFYIHLYTTEPNGEVEIIDTFFDDLDVPSISEDDKVTLEKQIVLQAIHHAIRNLSCSKAPGKGSYTA